MADKRRIAVSSNFDDPAFVEYWLNVPPMNYELAKPLCQSLNQINPDGEQYYAVVPLGTVLNQPKT